MKVSPASGASAPRDQASSTFSRARRAHNAAVGSRDLSRCWAVLTNRQFTSVKYLTIFVRAHGASSARSTRFCATIIGAGVIASATDFGQQRRRAAALDHLGRAIGAARQRRRRADHLSNSPSARATPRPKLAPQVHGAHPRRQARGARGVRPIKASADGSVVAYTRQVKLNLRERT